jgi:protein O-GlcNAc transferase
MTSPSTQKIFDEAVQRQIRREFPQAEALYLKVLDQDPQHAAAMHWLGVIAGETGRPTEALDWIRRAIAVNPNDADCHYNLGMVLSGLRQHAAAISAFEEAVKLRPDFPDAWTSLATAHRRTENYDQAIAAVKSALHYQPNLARAHNNLASYYRALGRADEALACYDRGIAIEPNYPAIASNRLFLLSFHPDFDSQAVLRESRAWNNRFATPLAGTIQPHANDRSPERRLRIGFVSPDFRTHCQTLFTLPLFSQHDRANFEFHCYADVPQPDGLTEQIRRQVEVWRNTAAMNDQTVADTIRADRVDILIDLTMHMAGGRPRLFAQRAAPIQIAWLAYPGTTGISAIDYRLTDPYLDPPGKYDADYSERSIRMDNTFWCYDPLASSPAVNPLPALDRGHITFGCLNSFAKVTSATLRLWSRILQATSDSRLIMLCPPGEHRRQVVETLAVDPSRIRFVPMQSRPDYLNTYHEIDLALDTLPYNGHTTTLDAFWMGVPVITLVGRTVVGRARWSQLNNLNLKELAAFNEEDFVRLALGLSRDLPRLADLRAGLRRRMEQSPLMDAPRFARGMERVFRRIWREYCQTQATA